MKQFIVSFLFVLINLFAFSQQTPPQQQMPPQQQQQVEVEVSDDELELFVGALSLVQEINQKAQQEMVQVIEDNDFTVEEFNQVQQKLQQSQDADVDKDDKLTFDKIVEGVEQIQMKSQKKMQESIEESGISVNRYQEILLAVQSNEDLYARFQEIAGLE
jgi:TolA-binding protein